MPDLQQALQSALSGHYQIVRELGRGGMGVVFLADDLKHDRRVALKVLRPELAQSLGADRFLREILISARLAHPNILTLIDSGNTGGFMYYVLPYVAGESLRDRLDREQQLPIDEALRITGEVADALAYAHSMGVVHRDIKPENILFEAGHAVVTDFGIARAVYEAGGEKLTESGLAIGTPAYMSPEQALGGAPVDGRADVYSLACTLYEMLAGEPPYTGATPHAILARKALEAVPGLRVVRETVPPGVETAIVRAMAKVPADRFATAREFAEALAGRDTVTEPRTRGRWHGLPPGRLMAAASVIVVVAAAAYLALAVRGNGRSGVVEATYTHFTVDPGAEWFPSFSPDGQWIVYSGEASGNRDIYLRSLGGENAIDLTADAPEDDDQPAFSPDGTRIAFRSERDGGGIFVMGRTGEAVRRVTSQGYRPTWSPDGTKLAYSLENVTKYPQNYSVRSGLWVADVVTGSTRRLADIDAAMPSWSPHGTRIAFMYRLGAKAQGHIWTIAADGTDPRAVTGGMARDWSPAWSTAGDYLYYMSDYGGSMNLWRVRIDERSGRTRGAPEQVTAPGANLGHVAVSADGVHLAYSSLLITTNVERAGFDPVRGVMTGKRAWVTHGTRVWADPDPSPDGRQVVFYSLLDPEGDLYIANADGSGPLRQLTEDSAVDRLPRWSPDGKWIANFSDRSGLMQIWKIRPDGSGLARLTDDSGSVAYAVWSPDGKRMVAHTLVGDSGDTFLLDPNRSWSDQRVTPLATPPDSLKKFTPHAWSPDGAHLAGMFIALDEGVIVYTLATGRYERLSDFGEWPSWLPDSRRMLIVSGGHTFYVIDRVTKSVRSVFSAGRDVVGPPQLTRDGRTVFYTRSVTEADIWVMTLH